MSIPELQPLITVSVDCFPGRQVRNTARSLDEVRGVLQFEGDPQRSSSSLQHQPDSNLLGHHSSDSIPPRPSTVPAPIQRPVEYTTGAFYNNSESQRMLQELRQPQELQVNRGNGPPDVYQAFSGQPMEQWNIHEQLAIESQLAEVNRQQMEAEKKLKGLIERQQQEAKAGMFNRQMVSPSISPITVELESSTAVTGRVPAVQLVNAAGSKEVASGSERMNALSQVSCIQSVERQVSFLIVWSLGDQILYFLCYF